MDALKALATKLKKEAQEVAGPKKYVKRTQLEEARLQKIRDEEAREREEKVCAGLGHGPRVRCAGCIAASCHDTSSGDTCNIHASKEQDTVKVHAVLRMHRPLLEALSQRPELGHDAWPLPCLHAAPQPAKPTPSTYTGRNKPASHAGHYCSSSLSHRLPVQSCKPLASPPPRPTLPHTRRSSSALLLLPLFNGAQRLTPRMQLPQSILAAFCPAAAFSCRSGAINRPALSKDDTALRFRLAERTRPPLTPRPPVPLPAVQERKRKLQLTEDDAQAAAKAPRTDESPVSAHAGLRDGM